MHSSKSIIASESAELAGRRIVLAVCGSVAAAKSAELARLLMRRGADVTCVMSVAAQQLVSPALLHWATGNEVITELTGKCEHVEMCGAHSHRADLLLVAPATANTISKAACGIDDTPVTTLISTALGARMPVVFAPAMHDSMYAHPFVKGNIERLMGIGVLFAAPLEAEGKAKLADVTEIADYAARALRRQDLRGKKVLVTAGATREYFDAVRFVSNPSSGKFGIALAREAWLRGADATLVHGAMSERVPRYLRCVYAETAHEMRDSVMRELKRSGYATIALAAAVSDFGAKQAKGKISSKVGITLRLRALPKISDEIKNATKAKLIVFKAEHGVSEKELERAAREKLKTTGAALCVANDVAKTGFGGDGSSVLLVGRKSAVAAKGSKAELAKRILDAVVQH